MLACDLMIRHGHIITVDGAGTVHPDGALAIKGNAILAVGPDDAVAAGYTAPRVLDAQGAAVHPGMIDPHVHISTHLSRTIVSDNPAIDSFAMFANWYNVLEDEDEHANALVACAEMALNGFTAAMEPGTVFSPATLAEAAEAVGVRISVSDPFIWDTDVGGNPLARHLRRAPPDAARVAATLGRELHRNADLTGRTHAHVSVYGSGSASEELEVEAKRLADAHGVVLAQHQNFSAKQLELDDARFGKHSLVRLAELGVLGPNCSFTHMNVIREDETEAVVGSGMSLIWQPGNYQYYGIALTHRSRMPELIGRGVNVSPCVDAAKLWTFGDMARIAYLVARQGGDYLSCETLLRMQTIGAAQALGLGHLVGSLEPGKRADIVIRRDGRPETLPGLHPVMQMMMLSGARSVDTVLCNGEVIVRRGELTRVDAAVIDQLGRASVKRMLPRL